MKNNRTVFNFFFILVFLTHSWAFAERQRAAVIGGGGSGLTTTWLLDQDFDVTLYETQNHLGGHANSIEVEIDGTLVPIEAGFEFISENQFPHFYNLLKNILKVSLNEYTLTTSFYQVDGSDAIILPPIHDGVIEWESFSLHDIFTMVDFNNLLENGKNLVKIQDVGITLEDYVDSLDFSTSFKEEFLYPFIASGWGVSKEDIKHFAAYNALKYIVEGKEAKNYKWVEIVNGTQKYIQALASQLMNAKINLSTDIIDIQYDSNKNTFTIVEENGLASEYDHLIIATNAMQACKLLKNVPETLDIRTILGKIEYFKTTIAIHGDSRFMPQDHHDWAVVNVRYDGSLSASTVYKKWLSPKSPIFKTWITYDVRAPNDQGSPIPNPLYALAYYDHPIANLNYYHAQKAIAMVQGNHHLWFAGNYTHDNDSHESAIVSAINIAKHLAPDSQNLKNLMNINQPDL